MGEIPLASRGGVAVGAIAYIVLVLLVGLWAARRTRNSSDFFIAGQSIGLFVTGMATMSAAFSGFVFLGGPGLTYRMGIGSLWIVLPVGFTGSLLCWVLAKRLRLLAGTREVFTIPDAIACRYNSRLAAGLAALAVALGTLAYLAAQLLALGILLQAVFGWDSPALAIGVGLLVLLGYAMFGGMLAGVYTDVIQGGLMLFAAGAVFVHVLQIGGGWNEIQTAIAGSEAFGPEFLGPTGRLPMLTALGFFFVFGVGVLGQPQMLHKFYMLDDPRKLKWMPLVLGATQSICLLIWLGIGLVVPALVARGRLDPLTRPDDAAPLYLEHFAPELLAGFVIVGVLAAIMSTADSFINIGSAAMVRDLPRALGRPLTRELFWSRAAVAVLGAVAALLAYGYGDLIGLLATFAFGIFGAALAPALAIGMNWKRVGANAACASIACGLSLTLVLEFLAQRGLSPLAAGVPPSAFSLAVSFAVLILVSLYSPAPEIDEDIRRVMER